MDYKEFDHVVTEVLGFSLKSHDDNALITLTKEQIRQICEGSYREGMLVDQGHI